jgi:integrative and conjugative element protein (TIGR02256 family)
MRVLAAFSSRTEPGAEAGGILIGQVDQSNHQVLICRASIPSELDSRSFTTFRRDRSSAQLIIDYEFYNSGGKNTYLGEWHTHPASTAAPSDTDLSMIEDQFRLNSVPAGMLLMIIAAWEEIYVGLYDGTTLIPKLIRVTDNAPLFD